MGETRQDLSEPTHARSEGNTPWQWLLGASGGILVIVPPVWLSMQTPGGVSRVNAEQAVMELDRARALLAAGRAADALAPLERSRQLNPEFAAYNNLCVAHGMLSNRDAAVSACERALELEPRNQLAKNNLAWVKSISASGDR
jgi:tetratricopeptide (TPR) repeat protein